MHHLIRPRIVARCCEKKASGLQVGTREPTSTPRTVPYSRVHLSGRKWHDPERRLDAGEPVSLLGFLFRVL